MRTTYDHKPSKPMYSRATRIMRIAALSLFSFVLMAAGAQAQEGINENGGFEQATAGQTADIAHWQLLLNGGATAEVVEDPADADNLVLRVELTDTSVAANPWDIQVRHYAEPLLALEEGHEHQMSVRIRAENPTEAVVNFDGQTGAQLWGQQVSGEDWTTLETGTFTAEAGEERVIAIHFADTANPNGQVFYLDDLEVVDLNAGGTEPPPGTELVDNGGFEEGLEPWETHRAASIQVVDTVAYAGSNSAFITNRGETGSGPLQYLTDEVQPGEQYRFSAYVKYMEGPEEKQFNMAIQNGPTWEGIVIMGSAMIQRGEWGHIQGTYTLPEDADLSQTFIFVETVWTAEPDSTNDLMDFYVDEVSFTDLDTQPEEPLPPADVAWSFEEETLDPWYFLDDDNYTSSGGLTDATAFAGNTSVELTSGTDAANAALVYDSPTEIAAGDTLRFRVWVGAAQIGAINALQPFVQYNDWSGWFDSWNPSDALTADAWNTIEVVVPGEAESFQRIGVQIVGAEAASTATIYVDYITINELDEEEPPPPPSPGGGLVTNGGFEQSAVGVIEGLTSLDGWLLQTSVNPVFEIVDDVAHEGTQALAVTVDSLGDNPWSIQAVADSIPVTPGATYEYSVWARTASGEGTAAFTVGNYDFAEYGALRGDVTLTEDWQQFTFEFTITDNETFIRAPIHFNYEANVGQTIYVDHLVIEEPGVGLPAVIVEAESGTIGDEWETVTDDETGTTYISITTAHDETTGSGDYPGANRTATYEVTFPDSGRYDLYARIRVGADGFDDDSFFYGSGFGEKDPADGADWTMVNQLASAGYTGPDEYIEAAGTAGSEVWKWHNVSENQLTGELPDTFYVSSDSLTRTFQIGAREDGLDIDKFAFAPADLYYTVANLDNGEPGVTEIPSDTIPEPTGPPLAAGLSKFLGNIYSGAQIEHFEHYWNQVTPENAGKWGSVEGTRDQMNWGALDEAYALAQDNGFPFRFHVLVWGAQQPGWISELEPAEQREEIREWFEAVNERYPDIEYVEVVNEALTGHNPPDGQNGRADYIEALGGAGETGYDWVITAFEMADEIFPEDTKLMINDYGILGSTSEGQRYRAVIEHLQERELIDAIGVQGHAFSTRPGAPLESVLDILAATGLPIQVTEMDVDGNPNEQDLSDEESDQNQLLAMQRIFPTLWEHEAVTGITLWGWRPGMWRTDWEAYLVRDNGEERPALEWLREYLEDWTDTATDEADGTPMEFRLVGNYPNPFNPSTQIRYDVAEPVDVRLTVYDLLGREVATLVDARQAADEYTVTFDARGRASGVYFYRLQAGSFVETKQMVLVK